jgi:hypothetical protein
MPTQARAVITAYYSVQSSALGPLPTPLTGIKMSMVDNSKHIFSILVFPTKLLFKHKKKHAVYNIQRLAWEPMLVGPPGNVSACPCAKTALTRAYYIDLLQPITVVQSCFQKTHQDFF